MLGRTLSLNDNLEELSRGGRVVAYPVVDSELDGEIALAFLPLDLASDPEHSR